MLASVISPEPHEYTVVHIMDCETEREGVQEAVRIPYQVRLRFIMGFRLFGL